MLENEMDRIPAFKEQQFKRRDRLSVEWLQTSDLGKNLVNNKKRD